MSNKITLQLPTPHPAQLQIILQAVHFKVLACGRRWGKTVLAVDQIIKPALQGLPAAWFGPTYKLLADVWRNLSDTLAPVTRDRSEQEKRIELITGGVVEVWSLDSPDAARGRRYDKIVVDEAAMVPQLEEAWTESLRPTLADFRGSAMFLGTPKGVANYYHTLYQRGLDPERPDWRSFQLPTSTNPYIDPAEIAAAREDMSERAYLQEFEAQFVSWEGAVFRFFTDAVNAPARPCAGEVYIGVDWGRAAGGDFTVFVAVDLSGQVLEIDRFRGQEYAIQMARLRALYERHRTKVVIAEANAMGQPVIEQLQRDGLRVKPFTTTNASKAQAIEALALAFERHQIRIPNDSVLIGELQSFEATKLASGMMRYSAPDGCHDDAVMALAMAWTGVSGQVRYVEPNIRILTDDYYGNPTTLFVPWGKPFRPR